MANISGISIIIKAFLPTGKTLDEQFAALSIVKDAHSKGDYSALLAAANIDEVKTEQKVRRMDEPVAVIVTSEQQEDGSHVITGYKPVDQAIEVIDADIDDAADGPHEQRLADQRAIEPDQSGFQNFMDGISEDRVNPDDDPLDQPVAPAPRRRRAAAE